MPTYHQNTQQRFYLSSAELRIRRVSRRGQALSIWQAAVLGYASAKSGVKFGTTEQASQWLQKNPEHPQQTAVNEAFVLLAVDPSQILISPACWPPHRGGESQDMRSLVTESA
jgi:hypothetical protein